MDFYGTLAGRLQTLGTSQRRGDDTTDKCIRCRECDARFIPSEKKHKFCTYECLKAWNKQQAQRRRQRRYNMADDKRNQSAATTGSQTETRDKIEDKYMSTESAFDIAQRCPHGRVFVIQPVIHPTTFNFSINDDAFVG